MKECACVPTTGISYNLPAKTFDVPSKPPKKAYLPCENLMYKKEELGK